MNPAGKHFIDSVDPDDSMRSSDFKEAAEASVAQGTPASKEASAAQGAPAGEPAHATEPDGSAGAAAEGRANGGDELKNAAADASGAMAVDEAAGDGATDVAVADDDAEWPSLDDVAPQRRRRSKQSIKRIKRRRRLRILCIVLLVICAVAAAGVGFVGHSVSSGRKKFEETAKKAAKSNGETITYNGKKYALNKHMATIAFIGFDDDANNLGTKEGQSDTVMVIALNTDTGEARGIIIPRDSMVTVDTYSNGAYSGQTTKQLCLQFSYGTDGDDSSRLTATAASRVLNNIPVDYYYTLNIDGVAAINDSIGGVTLTATQTVPDTTAVEGQEVTLFGQNARKYVQWRDTSQLNSSLDRTARQVSYLKAFSSKVLDNAKSNPATLISLYQAMGGYTWTNLGLDEFSYLATTMLDHGLSSFDMVTLQGTMQQGDQFAEFYLDQDNVNQTVVDTFYHEVK